MDKIVKAGRLAFGICLLALGIQGLFYGDFDPVFLPDASSWLPLHTVLAYLWTLILIATGLLIIFDKKAKEISIDLGGIFLIFFLLCHVPNLLFVNPNGKSLGTWTKALKELAFSGGAFVVAGSYGGDYPQSKSLINLLKKLIPFGRVFFSITMIIFGIDHFLYTDYVAPLVPAWIPGHNFWTYFAGVALIGSGVAIILRIKLRLVAALAGNHDLSLVYFPPYSPCHRRSLRQQRQ